ncbi:acyl-CoA Delta-9 desaturase-like isoform X1 [Neodiprion pinetum]|uniref:Acyl-CoA Delta-9 desaturase isoform X2 n=2 Tax=Neodiprion lecontei TaxID=441921 RepID=A0A6J0BFH9_NEOLC|nr:acyl-CoA Delta-9 desaturase isoform X2 [Neodiprion lecontei]XP_046436406.1 acyl-CoA Delta-9 desaturase-like isoform X1 [Neodiprion fabricii]XP_046464819.1 acyl-CoA Delta-9 desaturase-like isoform X1 [Neodiprion pinetum]XP_046630498.1 acyl-CoA Delta-9 desaturase-like isoform X1 [Neodiprion virginianus]
MFFPSACRLFRFIVRTRVRMSPNITSAPTGVLFEGETVEDTTIVAPEIQKEKPQYVRQIVWRNVIIFVYLHLTALHGFYRIFTSAKLTTTIFAFFLYQLSGLGITAGAHRLWAHKSYKAKWQLRLLLTTFNTLAFQDAVLDWARDHRVHHKYSETDADPHNAKRGFFFAHVGWLLCRKHPDVKQKGKGIDLSDLESDPILAFQRKYYMFIMPLICFILPTVIPVFCWDETWSNAYLIPAVLRYVVTLNATWLVNSAAHLFGSKPYDKFINPSENGGVAFVALGEGWHNYHHVFPWDYKTAELGNYRCNLTTAFIDFFAKIGWAYDLKSVSTDMVRKRVERTGDGSHEVWGWGDKDQPQEEREGAIITHQKAQ